MLNMTKRILAIKVKFSFLGRSKGHACLVLLVMLQSYFCSHTVSKKVKSLSKKVYANQLQFVLETA